MAGDISTDAERASDETRLVVETLARVIPGTEIVAVVTAEDAALTGLTMAPVVSENAADAFVKIAERVSAQLQGDPSGIGSFSLVISRVEWGTLVDPILVEDRVVGALVIARHGRSWSRRESSLSRAFARMLSRVAVLALREDSLLRQRSLDTLVRQVAEVLMAGGTGNLQRTTDTTVRLLGEYLRSDAAFLRRNDHVRGLSILVSEWPSRENVPDPDPLGEVPFDVDPVFAAMKDLKAPYMPEQSETPEEYLARVEKGSGVSEVGGGAVPLLIGDSTWGILGFLHFGLHRWVPEEINALQAVASMLAQLQARVDAEDQTLYGASHDYLTGLPNRRALIAELDRRVAADRSPAVMIIDLDRFKIMNDYLGHANGDELLRVVADRLRTSIRQNDFVARLGGDEFVFLLDKCRSELDAVASAYRILEVVGRPVEIMGQVMNHTASIGVALPPLTDVEGLDLVSRADVAMFEAKSMGRGHVVVFDGTLAKKVDDRSQMEILLRQAIDVDGLRLHFQPEVDLATGQLLAVEALVRWQHPTRGLLAASEFIKVAEETGLVTRIGRWVFAEACRQLGVWRQRYPDLDFAVRVNMSPADFKMGDLVGFVERCLRENDVPGHALCVEVTEHAVVDEPAETAAILRALQGLGVHIALDDFGTGFASMTELKNLPIEIIKLDMTFVRGIVSDGFDRAIVESIIHLSRALNLEVVAEGIESSTVVEKLRELGCHRGQGYLIAMPMAAPELEALLEAGAVSESLLRTGAAGRLDPSDA